MWRGSLGGLNPWSLELEAPSGAVRVRRAPQGPGGHDDWNAGRSPQPGVLPTCWGCLGHGDTPGRGAKAAGPASALDAPWKFLRFSFLSAGKRIPFSPGSIWLRAGTWVRVVLWEQKPSFSMKLWC